MLSNENLSLANMRGGAIIEAVDAEIQRVLNNIVDPNSTPEAKRTVTLTITFKPNRENDQCVITAQAKSNLAPDISISTAAFIGVDRGFGVAHEFLSPQLELPLNDNVTEINKQKENAND